jgi:hypothetical protein
MGCRYSSRFSQSPALYVRIAGRSAGEVLDLSRRSEVAPCEISFVRLIFGRHFLLEPSEEVLVGQAAERDFLANSLAEPIDLLPVRRGLFGRPVVPQVEQGERHVLVGQPQNVLQKLRGIQAGKRLGSIIQRPCQRLASQQAMLLP